MEKQESEFGKGLAYCLGLFLAHAERYKSTAVDAETWFNGASDHLYEIVIPKSFSKKLRNRITVFQNKCLTWGHGFKEPAPTAEDKEWAIGECKNLLLEIDKQLGIKPIRGTWE